MTPLEAKTRLDTWARSAGAIRNRPIFGNIIGAVEPEGTAEIVTTNMAYHYAPERVEEVFSRPSVLWKMVR